MTQTVASVVLMLHSFFEGKDPATPWMDGKLALSTGEAARKAVLQHHIQDVNPMLSSKIMVEEGTKIIHTFGIEHVEELHLLQLFYAIASCDSLEPVKEVQYTVRPVLQLCIVTALQLCK